jgi:hypothetical protein
MRRQSLAGMRSEYALSASRASTRTASTTDAAFRRRGHRAKIALCRRPVTSRHVVQSLKRSDGVIKLLTPFA